MDKIKLGLFDLFGHVFPGVVLLFAIAVAFYPELSSFMAVYKAFTSVDVFWAVIYLAVSYILSIAFHPVGYLWFKFVGKNIWPSNSKTNGEQNLKDEEYSKLGTYIREYSQNNSGFIEEWVAKRAMAFNLSLGFLALAISLLYRWIFIEADFGKDWKILFFVSVAVCITILKKARDYHDWYHDDTYWAIQMIQDKNQKKILVEKPAPAKAVPNNGEAQTK